MRLPMLTGLIFGADRQYDAPRYARRHPHDRSPGRLEPR
jgi:hypothetical protein